MEKIQLPNIELTENSYIKKETFIEMLSKLDFVAIRNADISFITGYIANCKDNEITNIETRGFKIEIY